MYTSQVILAEKALSGKSTNNVWFVYVSGSTEKFYCTSAYKAMRLAFLLKKRTGLNISDNILARLSFEIARTKAAATPAPEPAPQPKKKPASPKRTRKTKAKSAA